jgi:amino acid adenylation domain-containing protein
MDLSGNAVSIRAALDAIVALQPEVAFLISSESGSSITFRELQSHSLFLSRIVTHAGLQPGDKVAFLMDNGLLTAELFLGTMYGGFVAVPLNVRAGAMQLSYMLDHCDAKLVFVQDQYKGLLNEALADIRKDVQIIEATVGGRLADLAEGINLEAPASAAPVPTANDIALLMYSSGSTGKPKGALHTHSSILAHGRNSISSHQLSATDRSLLVLPLYHINAECVTLIPTLLSGGSVVIAHRFAVNRFWDWIDDFDVTWSALVPTIISELVDWDDPGKEHRQAAFQRIRFFRSSSAPLSSSLQQQFIDKFDLPLIQAMGSTEGGNVFSNPVPPGKNKFGSPGLPWGFETRIIDREGNDVPTGEPGEVLLRGPALMKCYYKDPEGTAAVVDNEGWLHTGDLARQDEDGYFFVVGRSKELIIKGGVNIAPRQIDEVLECHPAILEAAAVGIPDRYFGEEVVAFVVLREESAADERELLAFCETRLGHFKTPARIHFLKELPKGPSGKVQRLRLLNPEFLSTVAAASRSGDAGSVSGGADAESNSLSSTAESVEQIIAATWAEVLNVPEVSKETNFFALGGHSLLAIQCISKLRTKLPVVLSLSDFFANSTVAEQASFVRQQFHSANGKSDQPLAESQSWEESFLKQYVPPAQESIPRLNSTLPHPLSPLQQRLWFMEKLNPDVPVYNESEAVLLTGNLNVVALEKAFNVIIGRHEALRSTIEVIDGAPNAIIHQDWPLRFREFDLSHLTLAKRQSELNRLLIDEPRIPYSLETAPGIRVSLICLSEREHVLILNMHHIICDWASEGIIWRELSAAYRSFLNGEPANLPTLPISHRDYAVWNEKRLNEVDFSQDLAFWEENLKNAPALLEIPTDRPRPATMSYKGKRQRWKLSSNLTEALRTTSRQEKTSLFTIFAAALDTVLYRYTGTDDILLGLPIGDRDLPELQSTIGFLLHTHVLRTALSSDITFRELLSRVQKGVLDLYAHRTVPFDQVVRKLQPERNPSYSPLFQVMLNWRDRDQQLDFIGLEGLAVESLMASADTCKFDLFFFVTDTGDEIWLELEYNTDLFDHDRISRLLGHYQTVLDAVVADPGTAVGEIPLLTTDEYKQVVFDWNHTQVDFPEEQYVDQLIEKQIGHVPNRIAVSCGNERLTYRQLGERVSQLAGYLQQSGVRRNDLVAICVERSVDMIVGLLGIMRAGAAYLPLDPIFPPERLAFMLQDAQPSILLTQERLRALLPQSEVLVVALDAMPPSTGIPPIAAAKHGPGDLAYVLYTSGSTGTPKGVQIPHRALVNFMLSMQREPGITANDTLLALTTLSFDIAGLELYLPLTVGAHLVIASSEVARDGKQLLALMKNAEITIMQATPVTWRMLLDAGWYGDQNLTVLCGGESWSSELAMQLLSRCKSLWNMYGPTETTIWSAISRVQAEGHVRIGQPIANTSLYVLDQCNQPAAVGIPGELHIGGRGLALGYLGRTELTEQRFIPHPFSAQNEKLYKTGDLVRRLADGSIEFLRRLDHQIKLRGFRIELGEIESLLGRQPGIKQCIVTLQELDQDDRRLAAYIVLDNRDKAPTIDELRNTLKQQLPAYMVPSTFSILNSMPLTANGKIDRKALSVSTVTGISGSTVEASPRDAIESTLVQIWEKLLQVHPVGIRSNFFDLGGYSMLVFRLFAEVNKTYHSSLPIATIFTAPTIEQLAEVMRGRAFEQAPIQPGSRNSVGHSAIVPIQSYGSAAPLFIIHGVQGHIVGFQQIATLLGSDQPVYGVQAQTNVPDEPALLRLEDQAAYYVSNIRSIQPQGPYRLLGYCFGGLVALEIAQQLHALGQEVELLGLLDSHNRDCILAAHQDNSTAIRFGAHLERFLSSFRELPFFKKVTFIPEKLVIRIQRWSYKSAHRIGVRSVPSFMKSTEDILRVAADHYRPQPWHGRLTLFRTALQPDARLPWDLGWAPLAKEGVEICDLPGDHWTIFREPNIFVLAKQLRDHLESPHSEPELSRTPTEQLQSVAD